MQLKKSNLLYQNLVTIKNTEQKSGLTEQLYRFNAHNWK